MRQALSDVLVVELCDSSVAGSYCTKLFADLGADVVKVETPQGDELRRRGAAGRGVDSGLFLHLNTNKRSVALDRCDEQHRDRLASLIAAADLVVESENQGTLDYWGLDDARLRAEHHHLTVASVTGFGRDGPYAGYKSDDIVAQAVAGAFQFQDRSDQFPVKYPGNAAMFLVGNFAAVGSLGAVLGARASGRGSLVDCSAIEALASTAFRAPHLLSFQYRNGARRVGLTSDGAMLIPYGVYPCADGYVVMVTTIQQIRKMLHLLDDDGLRKTFEGPGALVRPETREAIDAVVYPWLLARTRAEATAAAQAIGFPLTGVLTPEEVLQADALHQRGFWVHADHPVAGPIDFPGAPYRLAEGGWALRRLPPSLGQHNDELFADPSPGVVRGSVQPPPAPTRRLPLEGVRVLDMTAVFSGPAATLLLADLGAEVIRVENPWVYPPSTKGFQPRPTLPPESAGPLGGGYGPLAPGRPDRPYNRHSMNNVLCRNKLSCTIDIREPEGMELFLRLVDVSDVFVENFKAASLPRMGIHASALLDRNPRLLVVRLPPAGLSGDWASWTGFGAQFDALTGFLAMTGHRGSEMMDTPVTIYMDGATGPAGAFAILAAFHHRELTGRGQLVELAQTENIIQHLGDVYMDAQLTRRPIERTGNRDLHRAPQGLYPCAGGRWIAVSVGTDDEWAALAKVLGRDGLGSDARFATLAGRLEHHDELDAVISAWTSTQDVMAAFHELQASGIPAGPLLDDATFTDDVHLHARGWFQPLHSTDVGTHLHPGPPYRGLDQAWRRGSPVLGEDNEYVYRHVLGVSEEEYERLREAKILGEDYLDANGIPY